MPLLSGLLEPSAYSRRQGKFARDAMQASKSPDHPNGLKRIPLLWPIEFLRRNILEARQQAEAEEMAKSKSHFRLSMSINIVLLDLGIGAVAQQPLDHRRNF